MERQWGWDIPFCDEAGGVNNFCEVVVTQKIKVGRVHPKKGYGKKKEFPYLNKLKNRCQYRRHWVCELDKEHASKVPPNGITNIK